MKPEHFTRPAESHQSHDYADERPTVAIILRAIWPQLVLLALLGGLSLFALFGSLS